MVTLLEAILTVVMLEFVLLIVLVMTVGLMIWLTAVLTVGVFMMNVCVFEGSKVEISIASLLHTDISSVSNFTAIFGV